MPSLLAIGLRALPYLALLAAICGAGLYIDNLGYEHGAAAVQAKWDADKIERDAASIQALADAKAADETNMRDALAAQARADAANAHVQIVYRTLTNTVKTYVADHPDTRTCGLDADGLRLWNDANAGTAGADGGGQADGVAGAAGAVPGAAASR